MRRNGADMNEMVTLRPDEEGRSTLLGGAHELVHSLDAAQAQRFADSLGGVVEDPAAQSDPSAPL